MMQNRLGDLIQRATAITAKRQAATTRLHFALRDVAEDDLEFIVQMAESIAQKRSGEKTRSRALFGQTRVVITGDETADVAVVWSHNDEVFLLCSYSRNSNGGWSDHSGKPIAPEWLTTLEQRYQQKRREVELVARSEAVRS